MVLEIHGTGDSIVIAILEFLGYPVEDKCTLGQAKQSLGAGEQLAFYMGLFLPPPQARCAVQDSLGWTVWWVNTA